MTKKLLFVVSILCALALAVFAADVSGKWTYEQSRGGNTMTSTLTLKADGAALTGSVDGGRGATEIKDGKVDGDNISFSVTRSMGGNDFTTKYTGKLEGDTLKLTIETPGRNGGEPRKTEVTAKRATT